MASTTPLKATAVYDDYGTKAYKAELVEIKILNPEPAASLINKGLIFVIDVSGSMNFENRLATVKIGLQTTLDILVHKVSEAPLSEIEIMDTNTKANFLQKVGYIAFIVFGKLANLVWDSTSKVNPYKVVNDLHADGNTNLYGGVNLALSKVNEVKQPCTVIIFTDGDANESVTDKASFISLYGKFPSSTTLISAGIGNNYTSDLISLSPVSFSHIAGPTQMIEFMGSVISDFILAIGFQAKLELINVPVFRALVGETNLGKLITNVPRTLMFSVYHSSKYPKHDATQRIPKDARVKLIYQRFDGSQASMETEIQRVENLSDESVENYYREEAIRLIAHVSHLSYPISDVERLIKAWDRPNAGPYRDSVLQFIQDKKKGLLIHEVRDVEHLLAQSSSQNAHTPSALPLLTPKTPKSELRTTFNALALRRSSNDKSPSSSLVLGVCQ